jgi:UDP-N-acetylmuramoylalanine--D-glutamate ligase
VLAWDDGEAGRELAEKEGIALTDLHEVDFGALAALVLSPGVPLTHPEPHWTVKKAREAGIEVIGDTEVFCRQLEGSGARLVAITGTNGKSTTTALIGHILKTARIDTQVGGNIGTAVFDLEPPKHGRTYVIEMSSFQIDLSPTFRPDVGVLLNLAPDHLDRHGTMENYAAVKARLFAHMGAGDTAVVSVDDPWCRAAFEVVPEAARKVGISVEEMLDEGISVIDGILHEREGGRTVKGMDLSAAPALRGKHNWQNAAAAWAACRALKLDGSLIAAGMRSFPGLAHRMEQLGEIAGVLFVNDSKATNADAAARSLSSFDDIYWIAGGQTKTGGIEDLKPLMGRVRRAYLIGEGATELAETLKKTGTDHVIAETMDRAVARAFADAQQEGAARPVVLLAPACASFDQYRSFEVRGDHFRELVEGLRQQHKTGEE